MDNVKDIVTLLQLVISFASVVTIIYGFSKFMTKPQDTLKEQVMELQTWRKDVDKKLEASETLVDELWQSNRVTQRALLAIIDQQIEDRKNGGDVPAELTEARKDLYDHLFSK